MLETLVLRLSHNLQGPWRNAYTGQRSRTRSLGVEMNPNNEDLLGGLRGAQES